MSTSLRKVVSQMIVDYKEYRPKFMTIEHASSLLNFSTRKLNRIHSGEEIPTDDVVDKMGKIYAAPLMVFEHLGHNNDIGKRYFCRPLNQINRTFPAICFKSQEELKEMVNAMEGMCRMVLNGQSLEKWGMVEDFDRCFLELIDVEQLILEAKIKYAEIRGLKALEERYQEHDIKCEERGYRQDKEKQPSLVAERQAEYQIS